MFAAAPADKIKAVFDATPSVESLNGAWYAQMPKADADASFAAFKELAEAVKAAPKTEVATVAAPSMDGPVGQAAKGLADASYPLIKSIDWANTGVLDSYVEKLNEAWYAQMPKADADASFAAFKELAEAVKAAVIKSVFDKVP